MIEANTKGDTRLKNPPPELGGDHAAILAHYLTEIPDPWSTSRRQVEVTLIEASTDEQSKDSSDESGQQPDHSKQNGDKQTPDTRTEEQKLADQHDYWRRHPWG